MAGLKLDDKLPRLINARTHSIIDYIHAGTNFITAAMLRNRNRRASWAAFGLGAGVLANALMTDYHYGVFRLYSFKVHGMLDYGVAATSAVLPPMLGIQNTPEATYFYGQGAGETAIAGISDYDDDSGSRRGVMQLVGSERRAA